jgi:hypothetical protein
MARLQALRPAARFGDAPMTTPASQGRIDDMVARYARAPFISPADPVLVRNEKLSPRWFAGGPAFGYERQGDHGAEFIHVTADGTGRPATAAERPLALPPADPRRLLSPDGRTALIARDRDQPLTAFRRGHFDDLRLLRLVFRRGGRSAAWAAAADGTLITNGAPESSARRRPDAVLGLCMRDSGQRHAAKSGQSGQSGQSGKSIKRRTTLYRTLWTWLSSVKPRTAGSGQVVSALLRFAKGRW